MYPRPEVRQIWQPAMGVKLVLPIGMACVFVSNVRAVLVCLDPPIDRSAAAAYFEVAEVISGRGT